MSLRQDYLMHKKKTMESFSFVKVDVNSLSASVDSIRNSLASIDFRISSLGNEIDSLKGAIGQFVNEQSSQQVQIEKIVAQLKIQNETINSFHSFESRLKELKKNNDIQSGNVDKVWKDIKFLKKGAKSSNARNSRLLKRINSELKAVKKKVSSARNMPSQLKQFDLEIKKLKNVIKRKAKSAKKTVVELETKLKSQRKRAKQLNRKIENVKPAKRAKASKSEVVKSVRKTVLIKRSKPKKSGSKIFRSVKKTVSKRRSAKKNPKKQNKKNKKGMNLDKMVMTSTKETTTPHTKTVVRVKEEVRK